MIVFPNAKVNLGLYVTERRDDGYHNIESLFYPVPWKDVLEIVEGWEKPVDDAIVSGKVRFSASGTDIPGNLSENLCVRVFQELDARFSLPKTQMHLHKNIPIGAGLGGGSSDAAFCMKLLVDLFQLEISQEEQLSILLNLGSDCPYFWHNKPMLAEGRGELLSHSNLDLSDLHMLMVYPNIHISTREAYAGISPAPAPVDLNEIKNIADLRDKNVSNQFERSLFPKYPELESIKETLYKKGAVYASMSGSGSTVFGIFEAEPEIPDELKKFRAYQATFP